MHNLHRFKITKFFLKIYMGYNTIAICIVNKVLEKNVRFIGFKLEIKKNPFIFLSFGEKKSFFGL